MDCRNIHTLFTCIFPIQNFTYRISTTAKWGGFDEFLNSNYYVFFLSGLCRNQTVDWIFNLFLHIFNFAVENRQVSNQSSILGMGIASHCLINNKQSWLSEKRFRKKLFFCSSVFILHTAKSLCKLLRHMWEKQ